MHIYSPLVTHQETMDRIEREWSETFPFEQEAPLAPRKLWWFWTVTIVASATISGFAIVELWHLIAISYDLIVGH